MSNTLKFPAKQTIAEYLRECAACAEKHPEDFECVILCVRSKNYYTYGIKGALHFTEALGLMEACKLYMIEEWENE
jgi:hypothetical protein